MMYINILKNMYFHLPPSKTNVTSETPHCSIGNTNLHGGFSVAGPSRSPLDLWRISLNVVRRWGFCEDPRPGID